MEPPNLIGVDFGPPFSDENDNDVVRLEFIVDEFDIGRGLVKAE